LAHQASAIAKYKENNNIEEASSAMLAILKTTTDQASTFFALGQLFQYEAVDEAINYYEKCLELNPYYF